jgi:hypothetical protein
VNSVVAGVDAALRQAEDGLLLNPRVREGLLHRIVLRTGLGTLEICTVVLRVLARTLTDLAGERDPEPLFTSATGALVKQLLSEIADAVVSFAVLVTTDVSRSAASAEARPAGELRQAAGADRSLCVPAGTGRRPGCVLCEGEVIGARGRVSARAGREAEGSRLMTDSKVRVDGNTLWLPGGVSVRFVRTLRLPETGTHALPPGLGEFPVRSVADHPDTVPEQWRVRGGVMLPVYLREAMWLSFGAAEPAALQVGVGKVCAVSGEPWRNRLARGPQNYVVLPRQPWLDGINSGKGTVRQFVAVPLGLGATVEGQVTGEEVWGGVQLQSFPLGDRALAKWREEQREKRTVVRKSAGGAYGAPPMMPMAAPMAAPGGVPAAAGAAPGGPPRAAAAMGLGVGGSMRQEVYADDRPLDDWSPEPGGRVFVHLVTPPEWRRITGEEPPPSPVDRAAYNRAGLPWFDYYDEDAADLDPGDALSAVKPVGEWLGDDHEPWQPPAPGQIVPLGDAPGKPVTDGEW